MKKIEVLDQKNKIRILEFLYKDEMYNTAMIEIIKDFPEDMGEMHVREEDGMVTDFVHMKDDGNSVYTSFGFTTQEGKRDIGDIVKARSSQYDKRLLLGGKLDNVRGILNEIGDKRECVENVIFSLDEERFNNLSIEDSLSLREVTYDQGDIKILKKFTVGFFEADTQDEIERLTADDKTLPKIKKGTFFLAGEDGENTIGMARFYGKTENYIEITGVYIDKEYRGKGVGKVLIYKMIKEIVRRGKTPILETSIENIPAIKLYKSMGFVERDKYAFEFV